MQRTFPWLISLVLWPMPVLAQPRITVTLYDRAGLPQKVREEMKKETSRILLEAGVQLEWVDCEAEGAPLNLAECSRPSGPARLMLQLTPGINKKLPEASGLAIVQGASIVFACLYPDRLQELAREAYWGFGDLLGHAAAHELGHLLLRSAAHSHRGVMRALWGVRDLRGLPHAGLTFLRGQLEAVASTQAQHHG